MNATNVVVIQGEDGNTIISLNNFTGNIVIHPKGDISNTPEKAKSEEGSRPSPTLLDDSGEETDDVGDKNSKADDSSATTLDKEEEDDSVEELPRISSLTIYDDDDYEVEYGFSQQAHGF